MFRKIFWNTNLNFDGILTVPSFGPREANFFKEARYS